MLSQQGAVATLPQATVQGGRASHVAAASQPAKDQRMWHGALDSFPALVAILDAAGTILAVNAAWREFAAANGGTDEVGTSYLDVCDRADDVAAHQVATGIRRLLAGGADPIVVEYPCHGPDEQRWYVVRATHCSDAGPAMVVVEHRNITADRGVADRQRAEAQILDQLAAAVVATDLNCRITSWNRAAQKLYGWSADQVIGRHIDDVTIPPAATKDIARILWALARGHEWTGQLDLTCKDGSTFPAHVRMVPLRSADEEVVGYIAVSLDLTERLRGERELAGARDHLRAVTDHMAEGLCTLDPAGRLTYLNPTARTMLGTGGTDVTGTLLTDFLSEGRGPAADHLRELATASRHGTIRSDDELLCSTDGSRTPVAITATPLQDGAGTSWVVVLTDVSGRQAREEALELEVEAISWVTRLRTALQEDRLVLHAQPIVELATGREIQHELLLRLHDPAEGLIMPGRFIPAAEHLGFMPTIDRWVIDRGLDLAAQGMSVELNLCGGSFADPGLVPHVRAALERSGADPSTVIFEVTETDLVRNLEQAHDMLAALRALGFKVALDDFGTGHAGFAYLKSLPVDYLKIDREFVHDLATNGASRHVVRAVVHLARGLGMQTVAEGVEDVTTLDCLRELRVDHAQGYLFGRPGPIAETSC